MTHDLERIKEGLPHGSGINYDWYIENRGQYYGMYNSYDVMNEWGYEIGAASFQLIVPKNDPMEFRLHFVGRRSGYLANYYGLRCPLEDLFAESIREMVDKGIL